MLRVNLLPPEVIEKRKWDRYYPYVFVVAAILALVIGLVWSFLQFRVSAKNDELQTLEEQTRDITMKSDKLMVFELQQQELDLRKSVLTQAMGGRVNMGRLLEEASLILPSEVWLDALRANETDFNIVGCTPKIDGDEDMEQGFKSSAATLFRLGSLVQLDDVWLSEAKLDSFDGFQPKPESTTGGGEDTRIVRMTIQAKISGEPTQTGSPVK